VVMVMVMLMMIITTMLKVMTTMRENVHAFIAKALKM
jgi:hypothetical protein